MDIVIKNKLILIDPPIEKSAKQQSKLIYNICLIFKLAIQYDVISEILMTFTSTYLVTIISFFINKCN